MYDTAILWPDLSQLEDGRTASGGTRTLIPGLAGLYQSELPNKPSPVQEGLEPPLSCVLVGVEGFEPSVLQRALGLRPGRATSRPNTPNTWRRGRESNAQVPKVRPASNGIGLPHAEPLHQFLAAAARVERASPEGTPRLERNGLSKCPTLPSTPSDEDLSQVTPDRGGGSRT